MRNSICSVLSLLFLLTATQGLRAADDDASILFEKPQAVEVKIAEKTLHEIGDKYVEAVTARAKGAERKKKAYEALEKSLEPVKEDLLKQLKLPQGTELETMLDRNGPKERCFVFFVAGKNNTFSHLIEIELTLKDGKVDTYKTTLAESKRPRPNPADR